MHTIKLHLKDNFPPVAPGTPAQEVRRVELCLDFQRMFLEKFLQLKCDILVPGLTKAALKLDALKPELDLSFSEEC